MNAIVSNLIVASIEDCLPFYVERLGFARTVEVPHEGKLGFVILKHGELELMLQSRASVAADVAGLDPDGFRAALYIEVDKLAPIRKALNGWPRVIPERTTFYGAREIIVRDPAGNVVTFASRET
jgi:catechol 2,3-dioxygenase-like lactoylglutathione lyase family enzyme